MNDHERVLSTDSTQMTFRIDALERSITNQLRELADLRRDIYGLQPPGQAAAHCEEEDRFSGDEPEPNRRTFLRRVVGTAAGLGVLGAVSQSSPAAAANGDFVTVGQAKTGTAPTELTNTVAGTDTTVSAFKATGPSDRTGLWGIANGASGFGVSGQSDQGYGVVGASTSGYAVFAAGNGRLGMAAHLAVAPPTIGSYGLGDLVRDASGEVYLCVVAGTPGTWRKVGGPSSAGQFHLVNPSVRAIDTRGGAKPSDGSTVTVTLPSAVPPGATAVSVNLTATETDAAGWLSLFSPATGFSGTSTLNWLAANQNIANAAITACSNGSVAVRVRGTSHFILDVNGYWL